MNFVIITHVKHIKQNENFFAYAPYVREMNIWLKHVSKVTIVAPLVNYEKSEIDISYQHNNINFNNIPEIAFTSFLGIITSIFKLPKIWFTIFKACRKADHIHLRCPGNIGLLGCLVQVFFPKKIKTAKYAGNWDPKSVQPKSYRLQKWLLSNTFLTKNMTAIVYGNWKNQSKNIKAFFTASFTNAERVILKKREYTGELKFVFLGSLVEGKRPLLALKIVEALIKQGINISFNLYGEGILKSDLKKYIVDNSLEAHINLLGNKNKAEVVEVLKESHFLILPSKSEGWPKAVAEAMFFGSIPIVTSISCVPFMLDFGKRGVLIEPDLEKATQSIKECLENEERLKTMSSKASKWSQQYTLDVFESEIIKLLKP
ncbi:glycosyltransferase family 4 protein [Algibacter sp. PT7-4]|uniref:glycosyltransferase family 4 protein n=1 Tax=Algibacter ulvanivorans TaxID=3400999 RepID=UPI003AB106B3